MTYVTVRTSTHQKRRLFCSRLAPAVLDAKLRILGRQAFERLVSNELSPGIDKSGRLLFALGEIDHIVTALSSHDLGKLHHSGRDLAVFDVLNTETTPINRRQDDILEFASLLDRSVGSLGSRLINGVDHIDIGMSSEKVFHCRLTFIQRAVCDLLANDGRVAFLDAEPFEEPVVALLIYAASRSAIEHGQLGGLASERFSGVFALEYTSLEVVSRQGRIDCVWWIRGRIQGDNEDPFVPSLLNSSQYAG